MSKTNGGTFWVWTSCQIRKIAGCAGTFSPPPRASDTGMHHGTCVTHVPWCMPGSLTGGFLWSRCGGENVPGVPGACATHNFMYLVRGPWAAMRRRYVVAVSLIDWAHNRNGPWTNTKSHQNPTKRKSFAYLGGRTEVALNTITYNLKMCQSVGHCLVTFTKHTRTNHTIACN